jgi:molybdopterin-binding protein
MLSTRNQIPGRIKAITSDKVVSEVLVATAAADIAAVITTASVKAMKLKKGDEVLVMVKATEAGIQKFSE